MLFQDTFNTNDYTKKSQFIEAINIPCNQIVSPTHTEVKAIEGSHWKVVLVDSGSFITHSDVIWSKGPSYVLPQVTPFQLSTFCVLSRAIQKRWLTTCAHICVPYNDSSYCEPCAWLDIFLSFCKSHVRASVLNHA